MIINIVVKDLAEVADHFDDKAEQFQRYADGTKAVKEKAVLMAEARTWSEAADFVRRVKFG